MAADIVVPAGPRAAAAEAARAARLVAARAGVAAPALVHTQLPTQPPRLLPRARWATRATRTARTCWTSRMRRATRTTWALATPPAGRRAGTWPSVAALLEAGRAVGPQVGPRVGHLQVRPRVGLTLLQGAPEAVGLDSCGIPFGEHRIAVRHARTDLGVGPVPPAAVPGVGGAAKGGTGSSRVGPGPESPRVDTR